MLQQEHRKQLFVRELRILHRLPKHQNVIEFLGCSHGGFCTRFVNGGIDILKYRMQVGFISSSIRLHIVDSVLKGLQALQEMDIYHGDIKPENIVIDERAEHRRTRQWRPQVRLIDFGLSSETDITHMACGSPHYSAPEVIENYEIHPNFVSYSQAKADLWSLGITVYAIHTGFFLWHTASKSDANFARFLKCSEQHYGRSVACPMKIINNMYPSRQKWENWELEVIQATLQIRPPLRHAPTLQIQPPLQNAPSFCKRRVFERAQISRKRQRNACVA